MMMNFSWFHCQALEVQFFTSLSVGRLLRCQTLTLYCLHNFSQTNQLFNYLPEQAFHREKLKLSLFFICSYHIKVHSNEIFDTYIFSVGSCFIWDLPPAAGGQLQPQLPHLLPGWWGEDLQEEELQRRKLQDELSADKHQISFSLDKVILLYKVRCVSVCMI